MDGFAIIQSLAYFQVICHVTSFDFKILIITIGMIPLQNKNKQKALIEVLK
jgi:hypothetical protein